MKNNKEICPEHFPFNLRKSLFKHNVWGHSLSKAIRKWVRNIFLVNKVLPAVEFSLRTFL
jgi:hypothetical protein